MTANEPSDRDSCPLGAPAEICINYEITGWGCAECTSPSSGEDGTRDARR